MQTLDVYPATQRLPWNRPHTMEHRFGRRFTCGTNVTVSAGAGIAGGGRLLNVSLSGAYIQTTVDLPLFGLVAVEKACGPERAVDLFASVVRKDADGVGVEWCETPARSICQTLGCARPCHSASGD
jgi:hypothetical protein